MPSSTEEDQDTGATKASGPAPARWRSLAVLLGLIAAICAIAVPFLPVTQDTAKIAWPHNGDTSQVNAPLTAYWAQDMQISVPCSSIQSVDARHQDGRAMLMSTVPPDRTGFGSGMQLRVDGNLLTVVNRGQQVAEQPLPPQGCDVRYSSDAHSTSVTAGGETIFEEEGDIRPRVLGIYSDIQAERDPIDGLGVSITPDTRYESSPTLWKTAISLIGVLALIGCLIAVSKLDATGARRAPRLVPLGWWRLNLRDVLVIGALGIWVIIGPVTADDGYILSMAKVREDVGYLTNYYRWFGVAEAPFGWFYHVYELMTHVSSAPPWVRLPSFLLGVLSWFLISREVLPRLGTAVRSSRAAGWAAAAVFLIWWMPFNNGLRPEPVAAAGSLLALTAVERALVTRRLLPLCLGLIAAAFTLAATPTGMIAVAPFLVSARPLARLLRSRASEGGWLQLLAPILGSGSIVLIVVFVDQTFASVLEATRLRGLVGPSLGWYEEFARYRLLFDSSADGSLSRRFPVLLLLLCTVTCLAVLLRRGRIPGAALGPTRRLLGTIALFFLLMALTPTKWTHHFGAFAAVGASIAALTALTTSANVLRSKRNRRAFLAALLGISALAVTGPNAYWFVSKLGVPWNDIPPEILGISIATLLVLAALVMAAIAFIENIRAGLQNTDQFVRKPERPRRALLLGSVSLVAICGAVAIAEFGSMAKAIHKQRDSYSLGAANFEHLYKSSCNLGDYVTVERDPIASVLQPLPPEQQRTVNPNPAPPDPGVELPPLERTTERVQVGFHSDPVAHDDPISKPPHGSKTENAPMWSSFRNEQSPIGQLRTNWYALPAEADDQEVAISVAGEEDKAVEIRAEFGKHTPNGIEVVRETTVEMKESESSTWADTRFAARESAEDEVMRLVVEDNDVTEDGWIALTSPRLPELTTLTELVGDEPTYMDWPAGFVYPCVQLPTTQDGISEIPKYRITASPLAGDGNVSSAKGGGPLGWIEEVANQPEVPSYLAGDRDQPWGQLLKVEPYEDGVEPHVIREQEVRPGWWSPGPGPSQADGSTEPR